MWESIIAEWSRRWGTAISGWWFDGCYWPDVMYRSDTPPNFNSFARAARSGNPNSLVAFNPGALLPIHPLTQFEDYTAGETNDPQKVSFDGPTIDGIQLHMLSYLGSGWGIGPPRFAIEQTLAMTCRLLKNKGSVTWDVPQANGVISPDFLSQLRAIGVAADRCGSTKQQ